jgi:hypothetical protein
MEQRLEGMAFLAPQDLDDDAIDRIHQIDRQIAEAHFNEDDEYFLDKLNAGNHAWLAHIQDRLAEVFMLEDKDKTDFCEGFAFAFYTQHAWSGLFDDYAISKSSDFYVNSLLSTFFSMYTDNSEISKDLWPTVHTEIGKHLGQNPELAQLFFKFHDHEDTDTPLLMTQTHSLGHYLGLKLHDQLFLQHWHEIVGDMVVAASFKVSYPPVYKEIPGEYPQSMLN